MELKFRVQTKILKPLPEVFDGIVNPKKLSGYFVSSSSGPLEEGKEVVWNFAEHGSAVVKVSRIVVNERICFEWEAVEGVHDDTKVEIVMSRIDDESTLVQISESGWQETQKGLDASYSNCHGWTHMSCCLKAYLEHGINLRAGGVIVDQS